MSDFELHHIDLEESSKVIWENLSKLFGAQAVNAKFSLKLQLFRFKMSVGITMSSHINNLRSLIRQLAEVQATVDEDDAKAILLNNLSSQYDNVVFTLSQNSQTFEEMIVALLSEEKRTTAGETKDDPPSEMALYSRYNRNRSNKEKGEIECYYCKKMGHTTWNCRFRANDVLKGKVKDKSHSANAAIMEEPPDEGSGDDISDELAAFAF